MSTPGRAFGEDAAAVLARHQQLLAKPLERRVIEIGGPIAIVASIVFAVWWLGISFEQILPGLGQLWKFIALMIPPSAGGHLALFLKAMGETLAIAFLGTLTAAAVALPLSLLAAENTNPSRVLHFVVRRFLDVLRGVDTLIWALVFVGVVGLGPFAGILAIAVSDTGSFGKLFSEAIEATRARERDAVIACGGSGGMGIRFGLVPQVLPVIAGQILYFFESNTRSATIIGIVGAGGIGLQLSEQIRTYDFDQVAFIVLMILVAVAAIDWLSGRLRFAIIGRRQTPS
ncbi:MAG TPA: phosphonate ABC transporter, permease protein PhnE [Stellaceae bacterium]|jgi:phosphonate transport system permease protein|nr:phosphonate ABC transporter, permease protein PhnE [Stellaceae bacterium]